MATVNNDQNESDTNCFAFCKAFLIGLTRPRMRDKKKKKKINDVD